MNDIEYSKVEELLNAIHHFDDLMSLETYNDFNEEMKQAFNKILSIKDNLWKTIQRNE